jgi:hypothetical protein
VFPLVLVQISLLLGVTTTDTHPLKAHIMTDNGGPIPCNITIQDRSPDDVYTAVGGCKKKGVDSAVGAEVLQCIPE